MLILVWFLPRTMYCFYRQDFFFLKRNDTQECGEVSLTALLGNPNLVPSAYITMTLRTQYALLISIDKCTPVHFPYTDTNACARSTINKMQIISNESEGYLC